MLVGEDLATLGFQQFRAPRGERGLDCAAMPFLTILTLTLATFSIGTSEFVIQGLLPPISADMGVSVPKAGLLVTGFALGIAIGGPIVAILVNRLPRKSALLGLMSIFVVGHVLCAVAPNYWLLMAARVVSSFCVGAFFGIGSVVAVRVARKDRRASAVALMWGGIATANIFGVPAGAAIGYAFGWRSTFWVISVVAVLATLAMALWLPETGRAEETGLVGEFRVLKRPQLILALALCVLICAGAFSVFTYIAPLLITTTGISSGVLPIYLLLFGVGGVIGMQVGGRFADRSLRASIIGAFGALTLVYLILLVTFRDPIATAPMMFVWGFAFYFPAAPIQVRVVSTAREGPNLASTLVHSGFNLGNAIGPFLGAAALSAGFNYGALPWLGSLLALAGLGVALWSIVLDRQATALPKL